MRYFTFILVTFGTILISVPTNYLAAQEYDDLYYKPNNKKVNKDAVKSDTVQVSDYERYRESLESEGASNENTTDTSANVNMEDAEYSDDNDYVENDASANQNRSGDYYEGYYEGRMSRFNSSCYSCGYYDWNFGPSFSFGYGYPYSGWGLSFGYGYPYHYRPWYSPYYGYGGYGYDYGYGYYGYNPYYYDYYSPAYYGTSHHVAYGHRNSVSTNRNHGSRGTSVDRPRDSRSTSVGTTSRTRPGTSSSGYNAADRPRYRDSDGSRQTNTRVGTTYQRSDQNSTRVRTSPSNGSRSGVQQRSPQTTEDRNIKSTGSENTRPARSSSTNTYNRQENSRKSSSTYTRPASTEKSTSTYSRPAQRSSSGSTNVAPRSSSSGSSSSGSRSSSTHVRSSSSGSSSSGAARSSSGSSSSRSSGSSGSSGSSSSRSAGRR